MASSLCAFVRVSVGCTGNMTPKLPVLSPLLPVPRGAKRGSVSIHSWVSQQMMEVCRRPAPPYATAAAVSQAQALPPSLMPNYVHTTNGSVTLTFNNQITNQVRELKNMDCFLCWVVTLVLLYFVQKFM